MKVDVWDIMTIEKCSIERATDRIIHMRENDAFALAYILRKIIRNASYDASNLTLSIDEPISIENIFYEDIATLSKVISLKPYQRSVKGINEVAEKIYDLEHDENVTCQSHKNDEEENHGKQCE